MEVYTPRHTTAMSIHFPLIQIYHLRCHRNRLHNNLQQLQTLVCLQQRIRQIRLQINRPYCRRYNHHIFHRCFHQVAPPQFPLYRLPNCQHSTQHYNHLYHLAEFLSKIRPENQVTHQASRRQIIPQQRLQR